MQSEMAAWLMTGDVGCVMASPAHPTGGEGLGGGVCQCPLVRICLTCGFASVAEKSKLEAVFLRVVYIKHHIPA